MSKEVTAENVETWLGSDWSWSDLMMMIAEIANGEYEPQNLKKDILELVEGEENG
tara:strand:+ start:458 stop:622 length:165 start_codon:yes stop_codon:yes gene_type:complete